MNASGYRTIYLAKIVFTQYLIIGNNFKGSTSIASDYCFSITIGQCGNRSKQNIVRTSSKYCNLKTEIQRKFSGIEIYP